MRLFAGCIFGNEVHKGRIAVDTRKRSLTKTSLLQVIAITAAPFPGVVQIEHSNHLALAHLHQQIVETGKNRIIINARSFLQRRFNLGLHSSLSIRAHQDAEIINAHLLHLIEFPTETFTVAALSF